MFDRVVQGIEEEYSRAANLAKRIVKQGTGKLCLLRVSDFGNPRGDFA